MILERECRFTKAALTSMHGFRNGGYFARHRVGLRRLEILLSAFVRLWEASTWQAKIAQLAVA